MAGVVLDLPCRRHDLQHRPPAKSTDQLVDQPVDVGHGIRPPEKTHPVAVGPPNNGKPTSGARGLASITGQGGEAALL